MLGLIVQKMMPSSLITPVFVDSTFSRSVLGSLRPLSLSSIP